MKQKDELLALVQGDFPGVLPSGQTIDDYLEEIAIEEAREEARNDD
jgi:hypothetical protein